MTPEAPEVVVVDYGMSNMRSMARAVERAGAKPCVATDPGGIRHADRLIVPGVGALGDVMEQLRKRGLDEAIREWLRSERPYLGVCIGLQVLLESGEEGDTDCLGLIPGRVARFPEAPGRPVPHMGWNRVEVRDAHPVLRGGHFYFVHGYRAVEVPESRVLATTEYGESFPSAVGRDACVAVQFHPEKSQRAGLALLEAFCAWSP